MKCILLLEYVSIATFVFLLSIRICYWIFLFLLDHLDVILLECFLAVFELSPNRTKSLSFLFHQTIHKSLSFHLLNRFIYV